MAEMVQANKKRNQSEVKGNRGIHPASPRKKTRASTRQLDATRRLKKKLGKEKRKES
tara:strand:- start:299 stop:469 length:171 start_codon:yes stop_codon:yes gene_type:complete